jgi:RNA recognition motif-containing protein
VLIVKNLPAKTTTQELSDMFSKHGTVSRLVLPPSGVTAVVEFTEPTEAKAAFTALAYTKVHALPVSCSNVLVRSIFFSGSFLFTMKMMKYSQFKHLPLYLEWGPSGTFATAPPDRTTNGDTTAAASQVTNKNSVWLYTYLRSHLCCTIFLIVDIDKCFYVTKLHPKYRRG